MVASCCLITAALGCYAWTVGLLNRSAVTKDEVRTRALRLAPLWDEPLTLPQLQSHLARAADLLRGAIDQADFKAFIFPLMFFKRISDTYMEEYGQALAESGGDHEFASFAENHRFQTPRALPG